MGYGEVTSSRREVWNWRSVGRGGGRRPATSPGRDAGALKKPQPIGHPVKGRVADSAEPRKVAKGSMPRALLLH